MIIITIIIIHEFGPDRSIAATSNTDMRRLTTDIRSEKCVGRRLPLCERILTQT